MDRTIEFKGVKFVKLTRGERAKLNAELIAKRREKFEANLRAAGITEGEQYFNELEAWEDTPRGLSLFVQSVNADDGQENIQLFCLRKLKSDATADDLPEMDDTESLKLACDLSGLKLVTPDPEEEEKEQEPRPSEPAVYDQQTS